MELITPVRKLNLNKKTISRLDNYFSSIHHASETRDCTIRCTYPECASEPVCRTDHLQSCAPCGPKP